MFSRARGAREDANKILIVITDGKKYDDNLEYSEVIPLADKMGVTRYAIGVRDLHGQSHPPPSSWPS